MFCSTARSCCYKNPVIQRRWNLVVWARAQWRRRSTQNTRCTMKTGRGPERYCTASLLPIKGVRHGFSFRGIISSRKIGVGAEVKTDGRNAEKEENCVEGGVKRRGGALWCKMDGWERFYKLLQRTWVEGKFGVVRHTISDISQVGGVKRNFWSSDIPYVGCMQLCFFSCARRAS